MLAYSANNFDRVRNGYVKLNGVPVWQASWFGSFPNPRGVNTVLVDPYSCSSKLVAHFDTFISTNNAVLLRDYLNQLNTGAIVVGVSADEPTASLAPAEQTLLTLGVDVSDVGIRGAFGFIAQKGFRTKTVLRKTLTEAEALDNQPQFRTVIRGKYFVSCMQCCYV